SSSEARLGYMERDLVLHRQVVLVSFHMRIDTGHMGWEQVTWLNRRCIRHHIPGFLPGKKLLGLSPRRGHNVFRELTKLEVNHVATVFDCDSPETHCQHHLRTAYLGVMRSMNHLRWDMAMIGR